MSTEHGFEGYRTSIARVAREVIQAIAEENKTELSEAFANHLYDLDGPTTIERRKSSNEEFFGKVFYGFMEISNSYESLNDISLYVRRFPYNEDSASRVRYLRYNVEAFLNEIYILKERLISYARVIERYYKGTSREADVTKIIKPLYRIVSHNLKNIVDVRGHHLHVTRYSDGGLDKLSSLELVTIYGELSQYRNYFIQEYRLERKKWSQIIKNSNENIKINLDNYFEMLFNVVFDSEARLNYPEKL